MTVSARSPVSVAQMQGLSVSFDRPRAQPWFHVRREPPARRLHEARGTLGPVRAEVGHDLDRVDVPRLLVVGQGDASNDGIGIALRLEPPDDVAEDRGQHTRGRVGPGR